MWSLGDWERVCQAPGAFNGRFLAGRAPGRDWLGRRWLRADAAALAGLLAELGDEARALCAGR